MGLFVLVVEEMAAVVGKIVVGVVQIGEIGTTWGCKDWGKVTGDD